MNGTLDLDFGLVMKEWYGIGQNRMGWDGIMGCLSFDTYTLSIAFSVLQLCNARTTNTSMHNLYSASIVYIQILICLDFCHTGFISSCRSE